MALNEDMSNKRIKLEDICEESEEEVMPIPKDSFGRFGDDLSEVILKYLSLENKLRLKCVSKQFRKVLFEKQYVLDLNVFYERMKAMKECLKGRTLQNILKECPNIRRVILPFDETANTFNDCVLMQTLVESCDSLKSFKCLDLCDCEHCLDEFFTKFGSKLTLLEILNFYQDWEENQELFLKHSDKFINLVTLRIPFCSGFEELDQNFPKLKTFKINIYSDEEIASTKNFILNHLNLEIIEVIVSEDNTQESIDSLFESLSQLKRLKSLTIYSHFDFDDLTFGQMNAMAIECKLLSKLVLGFKNTKTINTITNISNLLIDFKQLIKLEITAKLDNESDLILKSHSFRCCPQLTHLTIDLNDRQINERFFRNISTHLPRIRYLNISNYKGICERMVKELSKLRKLRYFRLNRCLDGIQSYRHIEGLKTKRPKLTVKII